MLIGGIYIKVCVIVNMVENIDKEIDLWGDGKKVGFN